MSGCNHLGVDRRTTATGIRWHLSSGWGVILLAWMTWSGAHGDEAAVDFARDVRPILAERCFRCHGADKQEGGLQLDRRDAALRGGDSYAPAIRGGDAEGSPLWQFISRDDADLRMPPEGPRLPTNEVAMLRRWIAQGAPWPQVAGETADPAERHWAFQPVRRPLLPTLRDAGPYVQFNQIDRFVFSRLEQESLLPSPPADKAVLLRRLSFDLLGLPPTPEELQAFVADGDPRAYERLVDRFLASPRFGERWARHWLDVVRFAESHGFEMNQARPNAWPYRDYVISSFNEDRSYDRFVREQLAGDQLGADVATGFLVGGSWDQVKSPDPVLTAQQRADELHDMVSTTGSAFLGLTVGCSRCHSHKFDPIPQIDYYAIKACLEGVQHGDRELTVMAGSMDSAQELERIRGELVDLESQPVPAPVNARLNVERFEPVVARKIRFTIRATNQAEPCLDELEVWTPSPNPRNVALAEAGGKATASGVYPNSKLHRLEHVNDGRYGNSRSWISNEKGAGWVEIEFARNETIDRVLWGRDREEAYTDRLATDYVIEVSDGGPWRQVASAADHLESPERKARRKELEQQLAGSQGPPRAYAGRFTQPATTNRFHRGDPLQPREPVAPGSLTRFGDAFQLPADAPESDRRRALAGWIAHPDNPLVARVMVNRLWQHHFGTGIVSTPSDFGINGGRPSHPQLLDWLAAELVEHDWSLKHIHRLIVLSATYRQSSAARPDGSAKDADSRLLWRFPPYRLEAEVLRDAVLAVSGNLDLQMGGPGFDLFEPNSNYVKVYRSKQSFGPAEWRRMVYQAKPRMQLDDTFGAFDVPEAGQIAPQRSQSTTALQALNLLNSPFLVEQAEIFAQRVRVEAGDDCERQVQRAFQLAFQRLPDADELTAASEVARTQGLPILCRALLNANEFLYVF